MSYATTIIENQQKLYSLGEQEGYRKILQSLNDNKVISNYDLIATKTGDTYGAEFTASYVYYKEFYADTIEDSNVNVEFIVSGMTAGRTGIVLQSGSINCDTYTTNKGCVVNYNYVNNGKEEYNPNNCVYEEVSSQKIININGIATGYAHKNFHGSDDMYITGSVVRYDIQPIGGKNEWNTIPSILQGKDYITLNGRDYSNQATIISFPAIAQEYKNSRGIVRVYIFNNSALSFNTEDWVRVTDIDFPTTRYTNYMSNINIAYVIANDYATASDMIDSNGKYKCQRWDAIYKLIKDSNSPKGFDINPNRQDKTGFDINISYTYVDYLNAWVPYPCDSQYILNKFNKNETV